MSQAVGNIVYGIRFDWDMREKARELGIIDEKEHDLSGLEELGFTVAYHASGNRPVWCGIRLYSVWDYNDVLFSKIQHEPTEEQRNDVHKMIAALPEALREMAGEPAVWFIWSSG